MATHTVISGLGMSVPPETVDNSYFTTRTQITDEWIVSRTGISERHVLTGGQTGTDLARAAALQALAASGRTAADVTHVLLATCTADSACPSSACILAHKLNLNNPLAVDVNAACSGFINCLILADALIARDPSACVLLVAAESLFQRCNIDDPATAVLFGDGAGAAVMESAAAVKDAAPALRGELLDALAASDGANGNLLLLNGGFASAPYALGDTVGPEYFVRMQGRQLFKHAVRRMAGACTRILERNGLSVRDVDLFVPHQANLRIIESLFAHLGADMDKVFLNVQKYGNTSAASIPIALSEAVNEKRVGKGSLVLAATFGAGLTWGTALLKFRGSA
ncbi:MAG: beta-ketoacyl-ACP synthase 3 [Desulfovibrio sp.]|jgi:3-oxoacyl-[acyl-carrier-protein] synthase-3|nr:beta-ketoacyl-ACP synthase 3 [Desulfovibrio sp.]